MFRSFDHMIRRRSGSSSSVDKHMDKGGTKNHHSRVCMVVALSGCLWLLLFYFHFVILEEPRVNKSYQIPNANSKTIKDGLVNIITSNGDAKPSSPRSDAHVKHNNLSNETQLPSSKHQRDTQKTPPNNHSKNVQLPPSSHKSEAQKTSPNDHLKNSQLPPISHKSNAQKKHPNDYSNKGLLAPNRPPSPGQVPLINGKNKPQVKTKDHPKDALPTPKSPPSNTHSKVLPVSQSTSNTQLKAEKFPFMRALRTADNKSDPCGGKYIFVHNLPSRFNEDMLKECKTLSRWTNMCKFTTYEGMGPPVENFEGVFSDKGWYATNQFAVDVLFSNRMKQYECLTNDSSLAAAIFVPFYAGFDVARYLWGYNTSMRDAAALDLVDWLSERPEWEIMGGKDHFLVAGRITWDFRRLNGSDSDWGNKLLFLPAGKNMSMLVVESSPWNANDFAIPYPTYFHPAKDADVFLWQDGMRKLERKWLFSFAGAPRPGISKSIRGQLIDQCRSSKKGKLLECDLGEGKCHSPRNIMKMFQSSVFCLQPQGDSFTRRSTFDSMLAGCIPVFFHPGSAYTQYVWHLPKHYSKYSVFIPEDDIRKKNVSLEQRLGQIPAGEIKMLREEVINLIPKIIYADPRSKSETLKDAFDVSVEAIIKRVTGLRRDIVDGRTDDDFIEEVSWRYDLVGREKYMEPHEWDPFFSKPKGVNEESHGSSSAEAAKNSWKIEQRAHS